MSVADVADSGSRGGRLGPRSPARRRPERSRRRRRRDARRGAAARRRVRRALRRPRRRARRPRPRRGDARARRPAGDRRPRRHLRRPALLDRHRRPGPRRAVPARAGEGDADRDEAPVLRARVGGDRRRRAPTSCSPTDGLDFCRHHLRDRAPLPALPALRARGEDPRREGADRRATPGAGCSRSRSPRCEVDMRGRRRAGLARGRALAPALRRPLRGAPHAAERVTAALAARPAHARRSSSTRCSPTRWSTTGCAATRTGSRAATSPTRPPTSRSQALVDRRPQPLRAAAPLVPAEGAAARARPAQGLRPHGRGHATRTRPSRWGDARELVQDSYSTFSPELGDLVRRFFDEQLDRRAGAARASARARSAPTRCRPCTRT